MGVHFKIELHFKFLCVGQDMDNFPQLPTCFFALEFHHHLIYLFHQQKTILFEFDRAINADNQLRDFSSEIV